MLKSAALSAIASAALLLGASPADAVVVYTATLNGPNESPANASPGTGLALVTIDDVLDTMRVQTVFVDLAGTSTASHIHCCTPVPGAGTAGVATVTPTFTGFPLGVTSGSYDVTFNMLLASSWNPAFVTANGGTPASAFSAFETGLLSGEGYLNIHSATFPGGEIRGFLQPNVPLVAEPSTYGLMFGGLAAVGWVARRRRRG